MDTLDCRRLNVTRYKMNQFMIIKSSINKYHSNLKLLQLNSLTQNYIKQKLLK